MSEAIRSFQHRIENRLWLFVIPWLETSPQAPRVVKQFIDFSRKLPQRDFWVRILFWVSLGFSLGLGIGMLAAILN